MKIEVGPTGNLIKGTLFDVNRHTLEKAVQAYDSQLYFKWNPNKNRQQGVWELWRRPDKKSIVETIQLNGIGIHRIDYKETAIENHVFDVPYLSYSLLQKLKDCDIWAKINYDDKRLHRVTEFTDKVDDRYYQNKYEIRDKHQKEMLDNLLEDKGILKDFQERIVSGVDPRHLLRYWK